MLAQDSIVKPAGSNTAPGSPTRSRSFFVVAIAIVIAIVLIIVGRLIIGYRASSVTAPQPEPPVSVLLIPVHLDSEYVRSSRHIGLVEPGRQTDLAFESGGKLLEVLVKEGAQVSKGDIIAQLDTRSREASRSAQMALRDALVSDLERAQLALERQSSLNARDFAAGQSLDDARLLVTRSQALIDQADAAIMAIDVSLDKAILRAPFDADVGEQRVDVGSTVNSGMRIARLYERGESIVRIGVPVELSDVFEPGSEYEINVDGIDYPATVTSIRKDLSPRTRTVDVRLMLDTTERPQPAFGQTAELLVQQRIQQQGYRVPVNALAKGEAGLWSLFLSVPDEPGDTTGHVSREHVDILHTDGVFAYVSGDLSPDAGIIQIGTHRVVTGQRVRSSADAQ